MPPMCAASSFFFLPAEHDPDSYIRANGKEAFARYVSEATPLSRFLIDAAREDCDLTTAEGRAHMAANAKPLWLLLPEGALKMQLLSELATQVQLGSQELNALWMPAAPVPRSSGNGFAAEPTWHKDGAPEDGGKPKRYGQWKDRDSYRATRLRAPGRALPASRADHATRILLGHTELWETLSSEDHSLLCELPAPHGPLFTWLESQLHEHGPLTWSAWREALQGHLAEELALRLMSDSALAAQPAGEPSNEAGPELRDLLNRMLMDRIKLQQNEAIAASGTDPTALKRYQELKERGLQLALQLEKS